MPQKRAHWSERRVVDPETGCWLWTGAVKNNGYGKVGNSTAHRLSYEAAKGPVPLGLEIDHLCRNKLCFNPDHLEAVTHAENLRRVPKRPDKETHCVNGHAWTPASAYQSRNGRRRCRLCRQQGYPEPTRTSLEKVADSIRARKAEGAVAREIAAELGVSMRTVWRALAA